MLKLPKHMLIQDSVTNWERTLAIVEKLLTVLNYYYHCLEPSLLCIRNCTALSYVRTYV